MLICIVDDFIQARKGSREKEVSSPRRWNLGFCFARVVGGSDSTRKKINIKEEREIEIEEIQLCLEDMEFCRQRRCKAIVSDKWKLGRRSPGPRLHSSIEMVQPPKSVSRTISQFQQTASLHVSSFPRFLPPLPQNGYHNPIHPIVSTSASTSK
jgi:hypothetical protein